MEQELLFDHKYATLCDAYTDISRYAAHLHINGRGKDYEKLRADATHAYANNIQHDQQSTSTENCQDIEEIVKAESEKKSAKQVYSNVLLQFMMQLDPHSLYISEDVAPQMQKEEKNISFGIGVEFKYVHRAIKTALPVESLIVDYVYPGTDAEQFLQRGDEIESINDTPVQGKLFGEIREIISSQPDDVKIKITRSADIISLKQKDFQKTPFYKSEIASSDGKFVEFRIPRFTSGLAKRLKNELEDLGSSNQGLILDLRGNPGGLVDEAEKVINLFISKKGESFYTEGEYDNPSSLYSHKAYHFENSAVYKKPMVVLVDSDTASASEIVSDVLQQNSRALILGNQTFGKGSVQVDQLVSSKNGFGGILITTIALVYYPNDQSHQIRGILPDYQLMDPYFEEAVETLKEKQQKMILHESDYSNVIQPREKQIQTETASLADTLDLENMTGNAGFEETCAQTSYQNCLEKYAIQFLEQMKLHGAL